MGLGDIFSPYGPSHAAWEVASVAYFYFYTWHCISENFGVGVLLGNTLCCVGSILIVSSWVIIVIMVMVIVVVVVMVVIMVVLIVVIIVIMVAVI